MEFSKKVMRVVRPDKPEQHNYSDCGIYLLHYVEKIFASVAQFYWPSSITSLADWFPLEEVLQKRNKLASLIREMSENQRQGEVLHWPNINFIDPAPPPRPRGRNKYQDYSQWLPTDDEDEEEEEDKVL